MKLKKINIYNFRSIKSLEITIENINKSFTYCLLGINESGKSSILKAIDFFDSKIISYPNDFFDNTKSVYVEFEYEISKNILATILDELKTEYELPEEIENKINIDSVKIRREHLIDETNKLINVFSREHIFNTYTFKDGKITVKTSESEVDFNFNLFINENKSDLFWKYSHKVILWKSTPEYLILDAIDLNKFSTEPSEVSVPLLNCFKLIGIDEDQIQNTISKLNTALALHNLQDELSDRVSEHIKKVWPDHPVNIKFQIDNHKITFLVEDINVKYKAKTTEQRSDGFKQFISFLLTVSIENINNELSKTILLIDEPEVHLHPPAQINLLNELIKISSNKKNNVVFFATHSNYLIDKNHLNRSFKILKIDNEYTHIQQLKEKITTYSEVNFEVFDICTNDYHNELYGYLEDTDNTKLNALSKNKKWTNEKTGKTLDVSLSTYIRHSIHHPENTSNKPFTDYELRKSIEKLRKLKYE